MEYDWFDFLVKLTASRRMIDLQKERWQVQVRLTATVRVVAFRMSVSQPLFESTHFTIDSWSND